MSNENNSLAPARTTNEPYSSDITQKKLLIERKLHEASEKADKSTVNAIAQGSRESLASQVKEYFTLVVIKLSF